MQISIKQSSGKVPNATIPASEIHKTTTKQLDAVSNSQMLIRNSNYKRSNPEIQSKFQILGTIASRIHNEALDTESQANSESKLKFNVPYLVVPDRAIGGGIPTSVRSGVEDSAFAKGKVDVDLVLFESEDDVTTSGADEAISLSRGSIFNDSAAAKSERTLATIEDIHAEDGAASSTEVGASAKGKRTDAIAAGTDGGLKARKLRRFFHLKPPPLLAAVLA
ncbi:hypothetical protein PIB30_090451 [Stylosanthes scabra]|uniref:Uncharacterized protein n=1 Tax=Stylosanthes scabra TaxID=79078 RepID=A0ABU6WSN9_9FABA|nr:hypothetical protein [Stylosanthes scabra]